jgi:cell division ATPase FtsA
MVFRKGALVYRRHTAGGMQVTNDISIMLSVLMDSAERLKREASSCWLESVDADELIVVPGIGGREPTEIPAASSAPSCSPDGEIFLMAKEKLEKAGWLRRSKRAWCSPEELP